MDVLVDGEIILFGVVGIDLWDDGFTAMDVVRALAEIGRGEDVTVRINSPGGYVDDGVAIFNALRAHRGTVTVYVEGLAASAASVIAMAGAEVIMRPGAQMMIHDPGTITIGDLAAHQKSMESLEASAASIADIYAEKTGRSLEEIRAEMAEEVWLTADQAIESGYADRLDEQAEDKEFEAVAFNYRLFNHAPQRLVAATDAQGWHNAVPRKKAASAVTISQNGRNSPMAHQQADKTPANTENQNQPDVAAITAAATSEGKQAGADEAKARIKAILDCDEAKDRADLARHLAFETGLSAEDAVKTLAVSPKAAATGGNEFERRMNATKNPAVGGGGGNDPGDETVETVAARIVNFVAPQKKGA